MKVYTVRDKVADEYAPPFLARTDGAAVRMFTEITKGQKIAYIDDLELYRVGYFDISTGKLEGSGLVLVETTTEE